MAHPQELTRRQWLLEGINDQPIFFLLFWLFSNNCIIYSNKIDEIIKIILYRGQSYAKVNCSQKMCYNNNAFMLSGKFHLFLYPDHFVLWKLFLSCKYEPRGKIIKTFSYICFLIYIRKHDFLLYYNHI